jgi:hypothetical protein
MKIAAITPVRYSYFKDGSPFRDYDRLVSHICSLKKQTMSVDVYIGDGSKDSRANKEIQRICNEHGAKYIKLELSDVFNRCLMMNETFKNIKDKHDYLCLLDMDLVLTPNIISTFLESYNVRRYEILVSGIHFLTISSTKIFDYEDLEGIDIDSSFMSFFDKSQSSRFFTANGLQFLSRKTFEKMGGLDNNFNLYCGTDDEILFRLNGFTPTDRPVSKRVEFCINDINTPMAFHLNHDSGTLSDKSQEEKFTKFKNMFRELNRAYLFQLTCKGKFKYQDNLKNPGNYLCKDIDGNYYWGDEKNVLLKEEDINITSLFEQYIKNKEQK